MNRSEYKYWAEQAAAWGQEYLDGLAGKPVRARTQPNDILGKLPASPPEYPESMEVIMDDFKQIVPDGMTHWQHPRFFAYFPANAAPASMIAEQLTSIMAAQCMLWQTSPAGTEMEIRMVEWLRDALGLPDKFTGVIQDSASAATFSAVLTMRERSIDWRGVKSGIPGENRIRVYASAQTHSSVDKAVRMAGIGQENLVKIPTDDAYAMRPDALREAIAADRAAGYSPAGIVLCVGGTSIGASDRISDIVSIAKSENLYTHVDAAWAGSAMICPEYRYIWDGVNDADSIVFNPHKWLGAQFDCSVQFLKDPAQQVRTLGLRPDYLQTLDQENIVNFNEWTPPLGRRFRALKIWFLLRAYGLEGLRTRIRNHINWAKELEEKVAGHPDFRIITECRFSLFTFQYAPVGKDADQETERLLKLINNDGRMYLTQTTQEGKFVIRFQVGQFDCSHEDVLAAYEIILDLVRP